MPSHYRECFRLDDPIGGEHMNIMKAGLITAHRIVAVSHGVRAAHLPADDLALALAHWLLEPISLGAAPHGLKETPCCAGTPGSARRRRAAGAWTACCGEQSWKLRGIVNGIDTSDWSPQQDSYLRSEGYTNYDMDSMVEGKARCKAALQRVRPASYELLITTCLPRPVPSTASVSRPRLVRWATHICSQGAKRAAAAGAGPA